VGVEERPAGVRVRAGRPPEDVRPDGQPDPLPHAGKGEERGAYIAVGRDSYYFNKHPFYAKPADRHLLIPDA
jgi:hypothetical protein